MNIGMTTVWGFPQPVDENKRTEICNYLAALFPDCNPLFFTYQNTQMLGIGFDVTILNEGKNITQTKERMTKEGGEIQEDDSAYEMYWKTRGGEKPLQIIPYKYKR